MKEGGRILNEGAFTPEEIPGVLAGLREETEQERERRRKRSCWAGKRKEGF